MRDLKKRMDADLEINGFVRDPNTGRYYRRLPNGNFPPITQRLLDQAKEVDPLSQTVPKPKNVLDLLLNREYGFRKNTSLDLHLQRLKTSSVQFGAPESAVRYRNWLESVMFLKAGQDSLYVLFESTGNELLQLAGNAQFQSSLVVAEVPHYLTKSTSFEFNTIQVTSGVADFCETVNNVDAKCFMYVSNDILTGQGKVRVILRHSRSFDHHVEEWSRAYTKKTTVWCCCCNSFSEKFAIGCQNSVGIDIATRNIFNRYVNGNVHAVHFNNIGSTVYCGIHTGKIGILDLRMRGSSNETKLYSSGVDEIVLLSDQYTMICGSFNGDLCKFDLRNQKKVAEYFGHVHTPRKVPFSVSEPFNLLCATGSDNVTRLWSLDGGRPVKSINSPRVGLPHRSWIVSDSQSAVLYLIQGDEKYECKMHDL